MKFECNFCHEQIATLLSLSTHIKFHRRRYCKYCYWILPENETMKEHIESTHRIDPGMNTCTLNFSIRIDRQSRLNVNIVKAKLDNKTKMFRTLCKCDGPIWISIIETLCLIDINLNCYYLAFCLFLNT